MAADRNPTLNAVARRAFVLLRRSCERRDSAGAERIGERMGLLLHRLDRKHRERTIANLALAFPEEGDAWRVRVAREVFLHFGRVAGEFLRTGTRTEAEVLAGTEVEGTIPPPGAVIAITGHFGNWEWYGHWAKAIGRPLSVVARDADDGEIQAQVSEIRARAGIEVLSRGSAARASLAVLRRGGALGLLNDQNSAECFVPFFGVPCGTVMGPAVLKRRTGAPLLPTYCVRLAPGRYRILLREPMEFRDGEDEVGFTARLNLELEEVVRAHPEQWLWMHDRWKSARQRGLLDAALKG